MDQATRRQEAVRRYLEGDSVTVICRDLKTSRKWFYKWYNRYQTGATDWYHDQSKAPKHQPQQIDQEVERLIVKVREQLEQTKFAQIGATAIAWHIRKLGGTPPPIWAINRILKRNDKIRSKKKERRQKSNVSYTWFTDTAYPGHIFQTDIIGPRFLKGGGRFYCLSTIDRFSHLAWCEPMRSKDDNSIVQALINTWHHIGVPDYQQFDNELSFQGSNRYPHTFGKVLKLCLAVGIQPVFIPAGEPWRNGMIERFNGTFDTCFFRTEHFANFDHFKERLGDFIAFHNDEHMYSTNHGKTPNQIVNEHEIKTVCLEHSFQFSENQTLPYDSCIHFIRFIRSDLKLRIRGESFTMPQETMYQYVKATIFTKWHVLNVFLDNTRIAQFDYPLPNFNQENPEHVIMSLKQNLNRLQL
jgi:transposase InsO family protein